MKVSPQLVVKFNKKAVTLVHETKSKKLDYVKVHAILTKRGTDPKKGTPIEFEVDPAGVEVDLGELEPGKYILAELQGLDVTDTVVTEKDHFEFEVKKPTGVWKWVFIILGILLVLGIGAYLGHRFWCSKSDSVPEKPEKTNVERIPATTVPPAPSVPAPKAPPSTAPSSPSKPAMKRATYPPPLLRIDEDLEYTVPENDGTCFPVIGEGYARVIPSGRPIPPGRFMRIYFPKTLEVSITIPHQWGPYSKVVTNTGKTRAFQKDVTGEENDVRFMDVFNDSNTDMPISLTLSRPPVRALSKSP